MNSALAIDDSNAPGNPDDQPQSRPERRIHPRYSVDCVAQVLLVSGATPIPGKMQDLSMSGCRIEVEQKFHAGIQSRVEVQFQLRGIAFRLMGATAGTRSTKSFAVRFLDMSDRRRDELAEVIAEVAAIEVAKSAKAAAPEAPQEAVKTPVATPPAVPLPIPASEATPATAPTPQDKRAHGRHVVDTSAKLFLVKTGICMEGRILNLSQGGCKLRTEERFNVGIYVRVEAEFYLHGLPFRLAGVSQAIVDRNTLGVRFLDMSDRKREQLTELIAEIEEVAANAHPETLAAASGDTPTPASPQAGG